MNYLNVITLKIFLCLLHGNYSIEIPARLRIEKENFIEDIYKNKLQGFFTLVRNNEVFKDIDYKNFLGEEYIDYYLINYPLKILLSKIHKDKVFDFVGEYINNFESGNFDDSATDQYYPFNGSLSRAAKILNSYSKGINKESSIKIPFKENSQNKLYEKEVRFFETVFYLDIKKIININSCNVIEDFKNKDGNKQKIDLRFTFKKDISSIKGILAEDLSKNDEIIFRLSYDEYAGDIYIKDKKNKKKLSSPHYDSINRIIFENLYNNPEKKFSKKILNKILKKELGESLEKKTLSKVAQELGFVGDIKKLFFITTGNTAKLRIEVTREQIDEANIDISKILP